MLAQAEVVAGRLAEVATAVRHHRAVVGHKNDVGFLDLGEEAVRSEGDVSRANINSGRMNFCATKNTLRILDVQNKRKEHDRYFKTTNQDCYLNLDITSR